MLCPFVFPFAPFSIRCCNQRRNKFFLPGKCETAGHVHAPHQHSMSLWAHLANIVPIANPKRVYISILIPIWSQTLFGNGECPNGNFLHLRAEDSWLKIWIRLCRHRNWYLNIYEMWKVLWEIVLLSFHHPHTASERKHSFCFRTSFHSRCVS